MSKKNINTKINNNFFLNNIINKIKLKNKRVLLRVDLNTPLDINKKEISENKILNDYKFKAILPTIDLLLKHGAKIILATHLSNPKDQDPNYSTKILQHLFKNSGYTTTFEPDMQKAIKLSHNFNNNILLLENLRFFKGEKETRYSVEFAKNLCELGDYFVNDAFGVMHRHDTSVTLVPQMFGRERIALGLLVEKEISNLEKLYEKPKKDFTFIIGGAKISFKLPLIENIIKKVDTILLCPAITFTFLKYLSKNTGESLVDNNLIPLIPKILEQAKKTGTKIVYPIDYIAAKDNFNGPITLIDDDQIPDEFVGVTIGPKTSKLFSEIIKSSKTVLFNGVPGNVKNPQTLEGVKSIYTAMGEENLYSVIAGGDSVAIACMMGATKNIDYLSTGGGAALVFFSNKQLPGLTAFENK